MIVPAFWAESTLGGEVRGRQYVTVRRFGWSDESTQAAQANADARVREAFDRVVAGEPLLLREPKIPYNGADGVPIREEIVGRQGESIITRNAYGARCLNTPDILFADIDFDSRWPYAGLAVRIALPLVTALTILNWSRHWPAKLLLIVLGIAAASLLARFVRWSQRRMADNPEQAARQRIDTFVAANTDWHLRLYRTPAGFRALAMHRRFDPNEAAVSACMEALGADPVYVQMCQRQNCFRARVSPKPWRIGIARHMGPRPGVWPIKPERMAQRQAWVDMYESIATGYAACRYVGAFGCNNIDPTADAVRELHDELSNALRSLPIG